MTQASITADTPPQTVFRVNGITCMDCARKFEQAVNELPGIAKASLNTMTGKLLVEGTANIESIRRLGQEENYSIEQVTELSLANDTRTQQTNWELWRAGLSGTSLIVAYGLEYSGGAALSYLTFYLVAIVLGGWGNFKKAAYALPRRNFNMSVLMSVAVIGAVAIGQYEEGASVAFLFAISELLEAWTMEKARRSIRQLIDISPKTALVRRGCSEIEIAVADIAVNDIMIIRPGEKIAMDGQIMKGETAVNQAAITGEAIPLEKGPGDDVYAGTLNTHGALEVQVTKLAADTTLAKIIHLVEEAQSKRAASQVFIEKFAAVYTPLVMLLAVALMLIPPLLWGYEWVPWIYRGLALLVVACPCALVVSTPVAIVSAISTAAKNGVLIKGGVYLETMGAVKAIAFDKTGTLTKGRPVVTDVLPSGDLTEEQLLVMVANLEARSEHPLAAAIVEAARQRGLSVTPVEDFAAILGKGAQGTLNGKLSFVGNLQLISELGIVSEAVTASVERLQAQGKTVMLAGTEEKLLGIIALADEVRETSSVAVAALKQAGIAHTIMLTGDNAVSGQTVAATIGIDECLAELLPQDKIAAVQQLVDKYGKVAMVGDGINDAPALAAATIGIAMGGAGTDTALETADIALMADDLTKLPFTIALSRRALAIIKQNVRFALLIKAVAVLAVFPGWLTLWLAILADMGATILVTLNSLRLLANTKD